MLVVPLLHDRLVNSRREIIFFMTFIPNAHGSLGVDDSLSWGFIRNLTASFYRLYTFLSQRIHKVSSFLQVLFCALTSFCRYFCRHKIPLHAFVTHFALHLEVDCFAGESDARVLFFSFIEVTSEEFEERLERGIEYKVVKRMSTCQTSLQCNQRRRRFFTCFLLIIIPLVFFSRSLDDLKSWEEFVSLKISSSLPLNSRPNGSVFHCRFLYP